METQEVNKKRKTKFRQRKFNSLKIQKHYKSILFKSSVNVSRQQLDEKVDISLDSQWRMYLKISS